MTLGLDERVVHADEEAAAALLTHVEYELDSLVDQLHLERVAQRRRRQDLTSKNKSA